MEQYINKPRVFLSHSEKDDEFVSKLADDLRKCQIEPWHFKYEIRHGKPWLDEIFNLGMPTCDAIVIYLTESSLASPVVKKEIDAGILQQLSDHNIAFLPYVDDEKIRSQLRPDIQALQIPEWNKDNYSYLLPVVVSEIWRSYLEKTVISAVRDERLKRVEAELELEKVKGQPEDVFTKSENKEFEFIWSQFERKIPYAIYDYVKVPDKNIAEEVIVSKLILHLSTVVALLSDFFNLEYQKNELSRIIFQSALDFLSLDSQSNRYHSGYFDITDELLVNGLIEKISFTSKYYDSEQVEHELVLTEKYYRFRFWLAYQQKLPEHILFEIIE